jgi:HK97 family phage major capsid protein
MKVKALRERRGQLAKQFREIVDRAEKEDRSLNAEENVALKKIHDDDQALCDRIENLERLEKLDADLSKPADEVGSRVVGSAVERERHGKPLSRRELAKTEAVAQNAWFRKQLGRKLSAAEISACKAVGINPKQRGFNAYLPDTRTFNERRPRILAALSTQTLTSGGNLVPTGFVPRLERAMLAFGGMLRVAEVITTDAGNDLPWPTFDDTSNEGVELGEGVAVSEQDLSVGGAILRAYKYTSKLTKVDIELMEDAGFDVATIVGDAHGERLARILNRRTTTGDGAAKPFGICAKATVGVTAASQTTIVMDEVVNLIHSVDPSYRENGKVMMHDATLLILKKLKDSQNRYLWEPSLQAGQPDRIWGYEYVPNQHMPQAAHSAISMVFGDFSKYKIRLVRKVRVRRLFERYAENDQEGFVSFMRFDGTLLDAGTHPVKSLQQA